MAMNKDLLHQKCVPCEGGEDPLTQKEVDDYATVLKTTWDIDGNKQLSQEFTFKDFMAAMAFVNKVAAIAESEGHHPDIYIYYNKVRLTLTTHAIGGLSINDFIIARKVEELL